ncbi:MAG: NFACT RNA binding domain-containing protein [Lachnospiraceae bacterium]|nr:NFACT RNA binding domain-containing protein [Lachnospiraceae bacterium]
MAFDGIVICNLVYELNQKLIDGRISKITQPEPDELLLTIKNKKESYKLLLSASASLPLLYLTETNKPSPITAPNFCMLLRKHISGGRIISITQPKLDRIVHFEIEHLNELGDTCTKQLTIELMGKHSNIIFRDNDLIIDSIKHVSAQVSSVREVLPGRTYFIPETQEKINPLTVTEQEFTTILLSKPLPLAKAIYSSLTGISPILAEEICFEAGIDSSLPANTVNSTEAVHLFHQFSLLMEPVRQQEFQPTIYYKEEEPLEFSSIPLTLYSDAQAKPFASISTVLEQYYASKNTLIRIRQKSSDLRRIVQTALERNQKKYDLQLKQLKDTKKREKYKIYGELIHTYGYNLPENSKELTVFNYYDNEMITIPLNPDLTPQENAKKYFEKYGKLKRTYEALSELIQETESETIHLESVATALDIALLEEDLQEIKEELIACGYIRRKQTNAKKQKITSKPFHYLSSDGFHIYVGKNNYQNEELTFQFAVGNDWWFHAKGIPGSHVIVKTNGKELPDRTFEEAGRLAAYYSKGRNTEKVEIDYTEKKNVKKVNGGKPGFVIYHTNYSMLIEPNIHGIPLI